MNPASAAEALAAEGDEAVAAFLARLDRTALHALEWSWRWWERRDQRPPAGLWRQWLVLAGRGFGKTRIGAEWVRSVAERNRDARIALVGATMQDVRRVMVEGESGLLAVCPPGKRPRWEPSLARLTWANGAQAHGFSASEPEGLRGPQHHAAWADEIAKWPNGEEAWNNLVLSLRLGPTPRLVATTTPRPVPLVRRLIANERVAKSRGSTRANSANLSPGFVEEMVAQFGATRFGRQELDGELIEEVAGALWSRALLERSRGVLPGALVRVVVGVDPPAGTQGDACGIVAAGVDRAGVAHVLEDASVAGASPAGWAARVAACAARHGAVKVIAEANNGGAMVQATLQAADAALPVRLVHASQGKCARAEPVSLLYEAGRVRHVGAFPELEDELCGLVLGGGYAGPGRSPDRADALVWALSELMIRPNRAVRARAI